MIGTGETRLFNERMLSVDNIDDFRNEIYSRLNSQRENWRNVLQNILDNNNYTQEKLANLCGVSKATVTKWMKGSLPQSRDMYIKIGFAAHYNLKEMNTFLRKYGKCPALYPKNPDDSIMIFVLNSDDIEHSYEMYENIKDSLGLPQEVPKGKTVLKNTQLVMDDLLQVSGTEELRKFMQENRDIFKASFRDFYDYVQKYVRKNNSSYIENDKIDNINVLADTLGWSSSLRKCVYRIYRHEWYPLREKVISLGIHLNMTCEEINEMLELAKMEPLYVMNPSESVIIYAVTEAELDDSIYEGTDDLFTHVVDIMREMGIEDDEYELNIL